MSKQTIAIFCVLLVLLTVVAPVHAQKLKPEELVAKHLDSIGPADKRQAVTKRMTVGPAQVSFRVGGSGTLNGAGNILSDGNLLRLGFAFKALDYSGEQVAFDGKKVTAGQISPGVYPPFSRFIYENDLLIKEGLLFGSLSTGWALLDVAGRKPKMESNGLKKIDGRQLHEISTSPAPPREACRRSFISIRRLSAMCGRFSRWSCLQPRCRESRIPLNSCDIRSSNCTTTSKRSRG